MKGQIKSNSSDDSCDTFKADVIARRITSVIYFRDTECWGAMEVSIIITWPLDSVLGPYKAHRSDLVHFSSIVLTQPNTSHSL